MHHAIAGKFGVFQSRNHAENTPLLRETQTRLESDNIIQSRVFVVLTELHHGKGLLVRPGVFQAYRLAGAERNDHIAPLGHAFNGHTALENGLFFKAVHLGSLGGLQGVNKCEIFFPRHRAVQIILAPVIAGHAENLVRIQTVRRHDRRGCVIKMQRRKPLHSGNGFRKAVAGQGTGSNNDGSLGGNLRYFFRNDGNQGMLVDRLVDSL